MLIKWRRGDYIIPILSFRYDRTQVWQKNRRESVLGDPLRGRASSEPRGTRAWRARAPSSEAHFGRAAHVHAFAGVAGQQCWGRFEGPPEAIDGSQASSSRHSTLKKP